LFFQKLSFDTFILFLELSSLSIAIKKFYEMKKREKKKKPNTSLFHHPRQQLFPPRPCGDSKDTAVWEVKVTLDLR
jgi:hypothetical protein